MSQSLPEGCVKVAIMGATGTGKSTFVRLLTNDQNILVGHDPESQTLDVHTSFYTDTVIGQPIALIDTPGFDDSRLNITDTDVLQKIIDFLKPEDGDGQKLNGLIYVHRISDIRVGGLARKNLRMFKALCGDAGLRNVRVVTTNWDNVKEEDGMRREILLMEGAFKDLLAGGAQMCRHTNTIESAQKIISELISLPEFDTKIQQEIESGVALGDTDAGHIINQELKELRMQHQKELAGLREQLEAAAYARHQELRDDLETERTLLVEKIARADEDRAVLKKTLEDIRAERAADRQAKSRLLEEVEQLRLQKAIKDGSIIKVAVMGESGTGKSTFINLLTNDDKIRVGHDFQSETADIQTTYYIDSRTGRSMMLIDTPAFDDSREGVTDVDILLKLANFLQPEYGEAHKLNGIIYMHRITDVRLAGSARKHLRMFEALCGKQSLPNVRVVTTNWDRVTEREGNEREDALKGSAFQAILKAGSQMRRHENTVESASRIMSEFLSLQKTNTRIQDQIASGIPLGETDAGFIIHEDIQTMNKKLILITAGRRVAELQKQIAALEEQKRKAEDHAYRGLFGRLGG